MVTIGNVGGVFEFEVLRAGYARRVRCGIVIAAYGLSYAAHEFLEGFFSVNVNRHADAVPRASRPRPLDRSWHHGRDRHGFCANT
jgi:hypothetical protein